MLKLTVNPGNEAIDYYFDQSSIMIGTDVKLLDESLGDNPIEIVVKGTHCEVINHANDPFISLNNLPFGRKTLKNGDQLQIGKSIIQIDELDQDRKTSRPKVPIPKPKKIRALTPEPTEVIEEDDDVELEALLKEADNLGLEFEEQPIAQEKFDEDEKSPPVSKKIQSRNWGVVLGLLSMILTLLVFVSGIFYFRISDKVNSERKLVAAAVADFAMALTHAKVHHIVPGKLNWSDPNFLHSNLSHVLSPDFDPLATVDSLGNLKQLPYILRIYTAKDLELFLIIAQPCPNVLRSFIERPIIVLESYHMELRELSDLRDLNRILASPTPLDEMNYEEISNLVKNGTPIPLDSLENGFAPPKSQKFLPPGSAEYVYNSPRYYPFGQMLLTQALKLKENPKSPYELNILLSYIEAYEQFPDLILYAIKGMHEAIEAQKALSLFSPHSHFHVATLSLDQEGQVSNSHLLMRDKKREIAMSPYLLQNNRGDEMNRLTVDGKGGNEVNPNHPLYLQLSTIAQERKRELRTISDQILPLINDHSEEYIHNFHQTIQDLFIQYEQKDLQIQAKINKTLNALYHEYTNIPLETFLAYVRSAQMEKYFEDFINQRRTLVGKGLISHEEIEKLFDKINTSHSLQELDCRAANLAEVFTLENIPDTELLIEYQKQLHSCTLQKIKQLLFSPKNSIAEMPPFPLNRAAILHIMKTVWVTDTSEFEYFLREYDLLFESEVGQEREEEKYEKASYF